MSYIRAPEKPGKGSRLKRFALEIILIALLVVGVIAFIAYPLFSPPREKIAAMPNALETLIAQRDATYAAIRDLDFDFQLGKLSAGDYATLREKYKARAALMLQQIDALGGGNGAAEAQIEAQVAQLRRAKADAIEDEVARVRAARKPTDIRCRHCDAPYQAGDQFCARCGNRI